MCFFFHFQFNFYLRYVFQNILPIVLSIFLLAFVRPQNRFQCLGKQLNVIENYIYYEKICMKTLNHFTSENTNKYFDATFQQTTLAEIQSTYFPSKFSQSPSNHGRCLKNQDMEIQKQQEHLKKRKESQGEKWILEMRGKRHEIDYGSVKEFERSFEKVVCEGGLVFPLAVKIVILEKLVKKKKEFSKLLEKCIEQYGSKKFYEIEASQSFI